MARTLGSDPERGLGADEARERLARFGPNLLPESVPRSAWAILAEQFTSWPVLMLGAAAALSALTGGLADAAVIAAVVAVNATVGYLTESRAERTIHSLKTLVRPTGVVVRDGDPVAVAAADVVPGDVLLLRPGTYVSADARLLEATHLSVDESALTGESLPAAKDTAVLEAAAAPLADRRNMVFMGTLVTGGQGAAVAVATGPFTQLGIIQQLVGETSAPETPMEARLRVMGNQLALAAGGVCGLVLILGLARGLGLLPMLKTSVSLAVAAVPEGLPMVATTTLALGLQRMRRHRVLIRHLQAVETLGAFQTVCLDKTGTLTRNRMTVTAVLAGGTHFRATAGLLFAGAEPVDLEARPEVNRLLETVALCSESRLEPRGTAWAVQGTPTENALVELAMAAGVEVAALRGRHPLRRTIHRSERRNAMTTFHDEPGGGTLVAVKGAPAEVLAECSWRLAAGGLLPLQEEDRDLLLAENEQLAGEGLRVLGAAYGRFPAGEDDPQDAAPLVWLGLVGMEDPVREGVRELIGRLHAAGIETVMITGDQSATAWAVARRLDLGRNGHVEILDSTRLDALPPELLRSLVPRVDVFARVSPAHKLRIVRALQEGGCVVAMTGDGINDGPALKAADIGIALGESGTDVAREVADVVVEDDNLQTLLVAVGQGRAIFDNIRKAVSFLLATNLSEIVVTFTAIAAGMGTPLSAMQLLWINLVTDVAPALGLALEPPEPDVLARPPRAASEPILRPGDLRRLALQAGVISAGTLGAYGAALARYGPGARAGTVAFLTLTAAQLLHALSCRSTHRILGGPPRPPNPALTGAIGVSFALQVAATALPGLRGLLGSAPVGAADTVLIGAGSLGSLAINEFVLKRETGGSARP